MPLASITITGAAETPPTDGAVVVPESVKSADTTPPKMRAAADQSLRNLPRGCLACLPVMRPNRSSQARSLTILTVSALVESPHRTGKKMTEGAIPLVV